MKNLTKMFQVKVLVVSFKILGVLQHPQAPTCLRPCIGYLILKDSYRQSMMDI